MKQVTLNVTLVGTKRASLKRLPSCAFHAQPFQGIAKNSVKNKKQLMDQRASKDCPANRPATEIASKFNIGVQHVMSEHIASQTLS